MTHRIPSHPIASHRIPSHHIPSHPIPSRLIPSHLIPSHTTPHDAITPSRYDAAPSHASVSSSISSHPNTIPPYSVQRLTTILSSYASGWNGKDCIPSLPQASGARFRGERQQGGDGEGRQGEDGVGMGAVFGWCGTASRCVAECV